MEIGTRRGVFWLFNKIVVTQREGVGGRGDLCKDAQLFSLGLEVLFTCREIEVHEVKGFGVIGEGGKAKDDSASSQAFMFINVKVGDVVLCGKRGFDEDHNPCGFVMEVAVKTQPARERIRKVSSFVCVKFGLLEENDIIYVSKRKNVCYHHRLFHSLSATLRVRMEASDIERGEGGAGCDPVFLSPVIFHAAALGAGRGVLEG